MMRPSFEELLVKYEKKGVVHKQKNQLCSIRDANSPSRHRGQQRSSQQQGSCATAPYYFVGSHMPLSLLYPYYCASSDYSSIYMQPYMISYPNYGALQQSIACNSNLAKVNACTNIKQCENSNKQDSKYTQSGWCPSGLSHTQKKRLQHMRKQESMEQQAEIEPMRPATTKKVWRSKQVVSSSA